MLKSKEVEFESIQDILIKKVNDRYKAPLLLNDNKLIIPMFPPITHILDIYSNTYNKYSDDYGKTTTD